MKKDKFIKICTASALAITVAGVGLFYYLNNKNTDPVIATINGKPFYLSQANERIKIITNGQKDINFDKLDKKSAAQVIKKEAIQRVVAEKALAENLYSDPDIQKLVDQYKQQVVFNKYINSEVLKSIPEKQLRQKYNDHALKIKGKKQIWTKHILVETKEEAQKIKKLIGKQTFEDLARDKSNDEKTAFSGGDRSFILTDLLDPAYVKASMLLKIGEISDPVQTSEGWQLIKLEGIRDAKMIPYKKYVNSIFLKDRAKYINKLLKEAKIDIKDDKG